jgi:hypothetical protein
MKHLAPLTQRAARATLSPSGRGKVRAALILSRLIAALGVALCAAAALGAAILLWQAPHCRLAPARATHVPLDAASCERGGR